MSTPERADTEHQVHPAVIHPVVASTSPTMPAEQHADGCTNDVCSGGALMGASSTSSSTTTVDRAVSTFVGEAPTLRTRLRQLLDTPLGRRGLEYLAAPYTHSDRAVQAQRVRTINAVTAAMLLSGRWVYSPITSTAPLVQYGLPEGFAFYKELDEHMLRLCWRLVVLRLPGWESSVGVLHEIRYAEELRMPVEYTDAPLWLGLCNCSSGLLS